jgi:hypothetical protein
VIGNFGLLDLIAALHWIQVNRLKRQSHEKVGELRVWGISLGRFFYVLLNSHMFSTTEVQLWKFYYWVFIHLQSVQYNYRAGSDYIGECMGLEPAILPESWRWAAVSGLVSSIGIRIHMFPLFFTGGHNAAPESHPYVRIRMKRSNPSSHPTALASQVAVKMVFSSKLFTFHEAITCARTFLV